MSVEFVESVERDVNSEVSGYVALLFVNEPTSGSFRLT